MYMYYLYQFHDSLPASEAKLEDFSAGHKTVDTDTILLPNTEKTFYIDLRLVTYSQAKEAAKKPQKKPQKSRRRSHKKATNSIKHLVSSSKEINKSQLLVRIDELLTSGELSMSGKLSMSGELPIPMPAPLSSLPEVATCFRNWVYTLTKNDKQWALALPFTSAPQNECVPQLLDAQRVWQIHDFMWCVPPVAPHKLHKHKRR